MYLKICLKGIHQVTVHVEYINPQSITKAFKYIIISFVIIFVKLLSETLKDPLSVITGWLALLWGYSLLDCSHVEWSHPPIPGTCLLMLQRTNLKFHKHLIGCSPLLCTYIPWSSGTCSPLTFISWVKMSTLNLPVSIKYWCIFNV